MAKILVVPHAPGTKIRTRAGEIAKQLSLLGHTIDFYIVDLPLGKQSLLQKCYWHFDKLLFGFKRRRHLNGYTLLRLPYLYRGPRWLKEFVFRINQGILAFQKYDLVISSAYSQFRCPTNAPLIYDLVDDHGAGYEAEGEIETAALVKRYVAEEIQRAKGVLCSSLTLGQLAQREYNVNAIYIPNGVDLEVLRKPSGQSPVPGRIGFMGGIDAYVDLTGLIEAVSRLRQQHPEAELHLVGQGAALSGVSFPSWVVRHGFVQPERIPEILSTFQVGVLPFKRSKFTDVALPLKVLEYGGARKLTVATPLAELQMQNLPWVRLGEIEQFDRLLERALGESWDYQWDQKVEEFDWLKSTAKLDSILLKMEVINR